MRGRRRCQWCRRDRACAGRGGTDPKAVARARKFSAAYRAELLGDEDAAAAGLMVRNRIFRR